MLVRGGAGGLSGSGSNGRQTFDRRRLWSDHSPWRRRRDELEVAVEEIIRQIEAGECEFYVQRPIGDEVDLVVAVGPGKSKYLMSLADLGF